MGSHRKNYTVQFKEEAVKHVIKVGLSAASTDLGVDTGSPGRWKREFVSGRLQGKQSSILSDTEKELQLSFYTLVLLLARSVPKNTE